MYPIEKYRFVVVNNKKVIAISTFAGKVVRGVALCHDDDNFDLEKGKEIAAARCAAKVAQKRFARSEKKLAEADAMLERAKEYVRKMENYYYDSQDGLAEAYERLDDIMENFN